MRLIAVITAFLAATPAAAFPDGAPWGSADPDGTGPCAGCHFDKAAVRESAAIDLMVAGESVLAGRDYRMVIRFEDPDAYISGFIAYASSGSFIRSDSNDVAKSQTRSVKPQLMHGGIAKFPIGWKAPADARVGDIVTFLIAVNAADGDGSQFGDQVHYRKVEVTVAGAPAAAR